MCGMGVEFDGFAWDHGNREKCQKHGVSLGEIEDLFLDSDRLVLPDHRHSGKARRLLAIGRTAEERHLYVAFTLRQAGELLQLRPISARYMHGKEIEAYAKARARIQE